MTDRAIADLRVAVVDDDAFARDLIRRALEQLGIKVAGTAEDGAAALRLLEEEQVDVLVCDLNMPGMDGLELLRHLADRADAPALAMISGDDHILRIAADLGRVHRLRVLGTIAKPATPNALRDVLGRLGSDWPPPSVLAYAAANLMLDTAEILAMVPDRLELHYQPLIDLRTRRAVGVEVLSRLRHANGLIGPAIFVPLFEQRGLTQTLFRAVVSSSLAQLSAWREEGLSIRLAINVSADDLDDVEMVDRMLTLIERSGSSTADVTLELTETRVLPEATTAIEVLSRLRMRGVGLALDDYGTGFSSLQRLRRVPFTELKIDQTFVSNATTDDHAKAMVASTVQLARELKLTTVAEGVETAEQLELVAELGCDVAQGFYVAVPMDADQATVWLKEHLK